MCRSIVGMQIQNQFVCFTILEKIQGKGEILYVIQHGVGKGKELVVT